MAAGPIATLRVILSADDAQMRTALGRSDKASQKWAAAQKRRAQATAQAYRQIGTAVAAMGAAYAAATVKAIKAADELAKQARTLDVTVETLQEYTFAAERSGVASAEMVKGLQQFNKFLGQAARGTGTAKQAFQDIGVSIHDANGNLRDSQDVMTDFIDKLADIENPAMRAGLAADVFGRAGVKLLPMLKDGSAGLNDMRKAAHDLGTVMDTDTAAKAEVLNDKLDTLTETVTTKLNTALIQTAAEGLPGIVRGIDILEGFGNAIHGVVLASGIMKSVVVAGLSKYAAGVLSLFRNVIDSAAHFASIVPDQMRLLGLKLQRGVVNTIDSAARLADQALSKAPQFVKELFGYTDGDYSEATAAAVARIDASIAAVGARLDQAGANYSSKPSIAETALTMISDDSIAEIDGKIAAVQAKFATAQALVTGTAPGLASTVNTGIDGLDGAPAGTTDAGVDGDADADEAHDKIVAQKLKEMEMEKQLVDTRRDTLSQSLAFAQQHVKGGSAAAKVLMGMMTALNIAQIISNTEVAKMRAMAELGPVAGPPMAAAIQAQGLVSAGIAAAQGVMGMFHDGIDNVPNTGTYLLEKGERVVDKRLNADLTKALDGGGMGGANITFAVTGVEDPEIINKVIRDNRGEFETMLRNINSDRAGAGLL